MNIFISLYDYLEKYNFKNYFNTQENIKNSNDVNDEINLISHNHINIFDLKKQNKKIPPEILSIIKNYNKIIEKFYDSFNILKL